MIKKRLYIAIEPETYEALKRLSQETKILRSILVREALDDLLHKYKYLGPPGARKEKQSKNVKTKI